MKKSIIRISLISASLLIAFVLFLILLSLSSKNVGPLDTLFYKLGSGISSLENRFFSSEKSLRRQNLAWFDMQKRDIAWLRSPDKMLFGVYDDQTADSYEPLVNLENKLDTTFPIIQLYTAWGSKRDQRFPRLRAQAIADLGSIPLITWEPWLDDFDPQRYTWLDGRSNVNVDGMRAIADGEFDSYIDSWAAVAKDFGLPFFLRFGHEMNDPYRYPWGPHNNDPADFIAAWQHVYERFIRAGAYNVIWVWSPHPAYGEFQYFYPGNEYVDWIGLTALNYGTAAAWSEWWSFREIIGNSYDELSTYGKPMMLTEFGTLAVGGDRTAWFREAFESLQEDYTSVKSVVYFHVHSDATTSYKAFDWSFIEDEEILEVLRSYK